METTPSARHRHELPAELGATLRPARLRRGWGRNMAADRLGIARGYLTMLEQGKRCPSLALARVLIDRLQLDAALSNALLNVARSDAGRSRRGRAASASTSHAR